MKLLGKGRLFPLQATFTKVLAHNHSDLNCAWFSPFIHIYLLFELKKNHFPVYYFFLLWFRVVFFFFFFSNLNEDISCTEALLLWGTRPSVISLLSLLQYLKSGLPEKIWCFIIMFLVFFWSEMKHIKCPLFLLRSPFPSSWYTSGHFMYTACSLSLRAAIFTFLDEAVVKDCNVKTKVDKKEKMVLLYVLFLFSFIFCRECLHLFSLAIVYCNLLCWSESYMFGAPVCCFVFMQ